MLSGRFLDGVLHPHAQASRVAESARIQRELDFHARMNARIQQRLRDAPSMEEMEAAIAAAAQRDRLDTLGTPGQTAAGGRKKQGGGAPKG